MRNIDKQYQREVRKAYLLAVFVVLVVLMGEGVIQWLMEG